MAFNNQNKPDKNMTPYEIDRLENIKKFRMELGGDFLEVDNSFSKISATIKKLKADDSKIRKINISRKKLPEKPKLIRRSARLRNDKTTYNEDLDSENDNNELPKKMIRGSFVVKFPWVKDKETKERDKVYYSGLNEDDFLSDDEVDYYVYSPKRRRVSRRAPVQLPVSQITPEMISNVHYSSSGKQYSDKGTTCHQCRQKTLDQKSYCRHKDCRGVRGMFCGFCLGKRYGEDVAEVLLQKKWACPPCRGYCNCSICRRREGKSPTGQMVPVASAQGYMSVHHLLSEIEGNNPNPLEMTSDDEEEKENISEIHSNIEVNQSIKPARLILNTNTLQSSDEATQSITPIKKSFDQNTSSVKDIDSTPNKSSKDQELIQSISQPVHITTTKLLHNLEMLPSDLQCSKRPNIGKENDLDITSSFVPTTKGRHKLKRSLQTVYGLQKKKKSLTKKPYKSMHYNEQNKLILSWFCTVDVVDKALSSNIQINDSDLKKYKNIPNNVIDELVDLFQVKIFFSSTAWTKVQKIVAQKKSYNPAWSCPLCQKKCENNAISCDHCLTWYHTKCVNLTSIPKKNWFCQFC